MRGRVRAGDGLGGSGWHPCVSWRKRCSVPFFIHIFHDQLQCFPGLVWLYVLTKNESYAVLFMWKTMKEMWMEDIIITPEIKAIFTEILDWVDIEQDRLDINVLKHRIFWEPLILDNMEIEEYSPDISEKVKNYQSVALVSEIFDIWSDKANKVVWWLWLKWARDDDDIINNNIVKIEEKLWNLLRTMSRLDQITDEDLKEIFESMGESEDQEGIIWDINDIEFIIFDKTKDISQKRLEIFDKMRDGWIDEWNSVKVADTLWWKLVKRQWFETVNELLNNQENIEKLWQILEVWSDKLEWLIQLWIPKEIVEDIINKYEYFLANNKKQKEIIKKRILKTNPQLANNPQLLENKLNESIQIGTQVSSFIFLQNKLVSHTIETNWLVGQWDKMVDMYADITWIWWDIADTTKSMILEIWIDIALLIIPLWIWIAWAKLAATGVNLAYKWSKIANFVSKAWVAGRVGEVAWKVWIEGVWFYESFKLTNNIIYNDIKWIDDIVNWLADWKEIVKSIAFIWTMRVLSPILGRLNITKINATDTIPQNVLKKILNETAKATATGVAMTWAGLWIEEIARQLWDETAYPSVTWKEFLELVVLAGMYKMIDIKFRELMQDKKLSSVFERTQNSMNKKVAEDILWLKD